MKEEEIFDAVRADDHFRLINLACTQPADEHPQDRLAVENYDLNTPYGLCIDRGSRVTIVSLSNVVDPVMGWWNYYVAKIGGFNYVAKELGSKRPYQSFYNYKAESLYEHQQEFMDDVSRLTNREGAWLFSPMAASGANEPTFPTQFHFTYGGRKGDETYDDPNIQLPDKDSFEAFFQTFNKLLEEKYQLSADKQRYHGNSLATHYARHLGHPLNAICMRVAWSVTCWDMRAIQLAQEFANLVNSELLHTEHEPSADMKVKGIGFLDYAD